MGSPKPVLKKLFIIGALQTIIQKMHFKRKISRVDAIIFYDLEKGLIKEWILKPIDIKRIIVRNPQEIIINLSVIILFIKNFKYVIGKRPWRRARFVYEKSLIDAYNPKMVITFRDNSSLISEVSKIDNDRKYYAIQNSVRFDFDAVAIPKSVFSAVKGTNFTLFSWGALDKVIFKKYSDYNCRIIPVGSLRASVSSSYRQQLDSIQNKRYDICLVSTVDAMGNYDKVRVLYGDLVVENEYNTMNRIIVEHLNKYINENDKSVVVSLRGHSEFEINFFKSILGCSAAIMPRSRYRKTTNSDYSTYHVLANSEIIISLGSSVTFEAIGMGKKVLQIDYSKGGQYFHHYVDTFWQLSNSSYNSFAERMDLLFAMDLDDYRRKTKHYADYVVKYNPDEPTYIKIQNLIKQDLQISNK